ncbi:hypothetical protein ABVT39_006690 [Epinephelus coioides]
MSRGNKDKKDVPTEPGGDTKDGDQAELETADGLDPALAKALSIMTCNIIQVIDDKLCPPTETIYKNATEIQAASKHLHEAEARLLTVEKLCRDTRAEDCGVGKEGQRPHGESGHGREL